LVSEADTRFCGWSEHLIRWPRQLSNLSEFLFSWFRFPLFPLSRSPKHQKWWRRLELCGLCFLRCCLKCKKKWARITNFCHEFAAFWPKFCCLMVQVLLPNGRSFAVFWCLVLINRTQYKSQLHFLWEGAGAGVRGEV